MSDTRRDNVAVTGDEDRGIAAEARSLRRRLLFWRRALLFVLGVAFIVVVVSWQRTTLRGRECRQALEHYAGSAKAAGLDRESAELIELRWQRLDKDSVYCLPSHYGLIVQNWLQRAAPGQRLPLAICREPHVAFLTRGRYVLYKDEHGDFVVEWIDEDQAASILEHIRPESR